LWAGRMEDENSRDEVLAGLQVVSALNLTDLCRFDEANDAFMTVLARGEALSLPQVQVNAMAGLICIADDLGRHEQMASLAERMLTLARSMGWTQRVAAALFFLGEAAAQRGDAAAAITWYGQSLSVARVADERLGEAMALHGLGEMHGAEGDANAALLTHTQAQDVYQGLEPSLATDENMACVALCQALLDQPAAALSTLRPVLERLGDEWAQEDPHATITLRWNCQRVLGAVADPRAAPMLQQLHADVQARVAVMTDADDRERLLQALPVFRGVVAAFGRRTGGTASSDRF
jgi:tetratricopeptide (TPR) repeat protein